jgi:hypothetical protein
VGCRSPLDTLNWKNLWSCDPAVAHTTGQCLYDYTVLFVFHQAKLTHELILSFLPDPLIGRSDKLRVFLVDVIAVLKFALYVTLPINSVPGLSLARYLPVSSLFCFF